MTTAQLPEKIRDTVDNNLMKLEKGLHAFAEKRRKVREITGKNSEIDIHKFPSWKLARYLEQGTIGQFLGNGSTNPSARSLYVPK